MLEVVFRADGGPVASQGAGTGPAGLTCIGVSQEGVLVLAAPQRGRGRRLVLRQPREAGDAHVVHGRVGAQGALLTDLVLGRHPSRRAAPPAAQSLPEVVRRGPGVGGWAGPELPSSQERAPHPHSSVCPGQTRSRLLGAVSLQWARRCGRDNACRDRTASPGHEVGVGEKSTLQARPL